MKLKTITTIYLDADLKEEARRRGIKISKLFNEILRERLNLQEDIDLNKIKIDEINTKIQIQDSIIKDLKNKKEELEEKQRKEIEAKKPKILKRFDI